MSEAYNTYIKTHVDNVQKAYDTLIGFMPDIPSGMGPGFSGVFSDHDNSKWSPEEYDAYDRYFYGKIQSYKVHQDFKYAWLHHIHNSPHHWQYWVLQNDDEPEEVLEMPYKYVIEMICDWWSFSFAKGDLTEIFPWYEKHHDMKLHPKTRKLVEDILMNLAHVYDVEFKRTEEKKEKTDESL